MHYAVAESLPSLQFRKQGVDLFSALYGGPTVLQTNRVAASRGLVAAKEVTVISDQDPSFGTTTAMRMIVRRTFLSFWRCPQILVVSWSLLDLTRLGNITKTRVRGRMTESRVEWVRSQPGLT